MTAWQEGRREDPPACREQDHGRFEVTQRDGRARLGKLHTRHGVLETPALLPVVNPNIRTIEPREMWDKYGIQALITNSYIIWKHDDLRTEAQRNGVHQLLDFAHLARDHRRASARVGLLHALQQRRCEGVLCREGAASPPRGLLAQRLVGWPAWIVSWTRHATWAR